jgi:hypothetical protein
MVNNIAPAVPFNKQEPIPGYIIKELIGSGGYGEVWKAHAPGGLLKAVKFVYGSLNDRRASRELRALNRIKEARHAFLLSIERIEVIDGNVIIITELADQSLKQCFAKRTVHGQCGLPREELLNYLRDAADALDYIYENYSLQHLDIKPENLLLVGNRAKVADFGLIKNLYDRSASLIEGLTPIYSPPELFAGKPNRNSDQYSLAIVYQEMLTGKLPFDGTTAAHLAAQHLHDPPVLSALPKSDQPIIARALSKDPDKRFRSCRALINALVKARGEESIERRGRQTTSSPEPLKTEPLGQGQFEIAPPQATTCGPVECLAQLPSIDLNDAATAQYGPVLFIGIGGVATRVFRKLRRRLHDRLGPIDSMPAVDFLLLDTDVKSINRANEGELGTAMPVSAMLAMPLRRAENYRSSAGKILGSISRRWLYNIPYSLQTEGFRPLGRLALVDHCGRLLERLRQSLNKVTNEENVAKTASTNGLEIAAHKPRVFIVASISGGTGGGMVLDVAYAVRSVLAKLGLSEDHVYGLLMHATPRGASDRDKAVANAYSTLSELWHYCRRGHYYPGDAACGLPPFHGNNRTFSDSYFVHLGDELTEAQLDAATDPVAEYLYSTTVTPAAPFFEKCRQMEHAHRDVESSEPSLRTFGLCQLGGSNSDIPTLLAELLCRDLVHTWRSGAAPPVERKTRLSETMALIAAHDQRKTLQRFPEIDEQATRKAAELELDLDRMQVIAREILDQEVAGNVESYFSKLIKDALDAPQIETDRREVGRVFAIIDAVLGDGAGADEPASNGGFDSLATVLDTRLDGRARKLSVAARDWIFELVDASDGRVEGAKFAAEWFQNHLRMLERNAISKIGQLRERILAIKEAQAPRRTAPATTRPDGKWLREAQALLANYARLRLEQVILSSVGRWLRMIEGQVTATLDRLQEFWKDLNNLGATFHVAPSLAGSFDLCSAQATLHNHWRSLLDDLIERRGDLVVQLDKEIERELDLGPGTLKHFLTQGTGLPNELAARLRAAARKLILATMQSVNMSRLSERSNDSAEVDSSELLRCVEAARPRVADAMAGSRLLVIMPQNVDETRIRESLADEHGSGLSIVHSGKGDLIAVFEVEQLSVDRVAGQLVDYRQDYIEIAKRLHTRTDVSWEDMVSSERPVT